MSEAHNQSPDPDALVRMARLMLRAVLEGKDTRKAQKACLRINALADDLEHAGLPSANVYPIRGDGRPFGKRPADLERIAAGRALRTAVAAELRALNPTRN